MSGAIRVEQVIQRVTTRGDDTGYGYETVAASQTDQALGATGAAGDYLHRVVVDTATGTVVVKDSTTAILTIPASGTGVWEVGAVSVNGAWKVTTAAGTTCVCIGRFT